MKKEIEMHFGGKKQSGRGLAGFVLSVLCIVCLLVLCILSAADKGAAGVYVGAVGMIDFIVGAVAFLLSVQGLQEQGVYNGIPLAGLVLSGILLITLFCLYIMGISI